mmetsp:Transcript_14292/g.29268  ORF Transcript_14292/g.29268 Transcript_14292/m.29268 type:complete len:97 (+) Transcript_14292:382-672(+)
MTSKIIFTSRHEMNHDHIFLPPTKFYSLAPGVGDCDFPGSGLIGLMFCSVPCGIDFVGQRWEEVHTTGKNCSTSIGLWGGVVASSVEGMSFLFGSS